MSLPLLYVVPGRTRWCVRTRNLEVVARDSGFALTRPRNDVLSVEDPAPVAIELDAAERTALIEVADRIGLQLLLLGHGMFAKILGAPGRAIAEVVGAVVVPPGALVMRGAVEDLETN